MNNTLLRSELRSWQPSATGTGLPAGVPVSLTSAGGAFVVARPKLLGRTAAASGQVTCEMYQHKTRIAANGGDRSGPHPAWDPV
jgi:hypothetical protein